MYNRQKKDIISNIQRKLCQIRWIVTATMILHFTTDANDEFAIYTGQTKFQMMICMLNLNATVWQQKLNTEDIGG